MLTRWKPALRMARRDLWQHKVRGVATMLLVALPVTVGATVSQIHHNAMWVGEQAARPAMGGADALVDISPYAKASVRYLYGDELVARPAAFRHVAGEKPVPVLRPIDRVSLKALLPAGSRIVPVPSGAQRALPSGGLAQLTFMDLSDPITDGYVDVDLESGAAPSSPDEAAIGTPMADAFGLLDATGSLRPGARLQLTNGPTLRVVGLLDPDPFNSGSSGQSRVVLSPDSPLNQHPSSSYLVDLPTMSTHQTRALIASLADQGVAMMPRDIFRHPAAWPVDASTTAGTDVTSALVGALVVLVGMIEVVLIVGSVFAVSARRQIHDLGLLSACGGARSDIRRVLFAEGLVLGVLASILGALAGLALFPVVLPAYEALAHHTIWTRDIDWASLVGVTLLGSVTGLIAALVPAWSISRLTPLEALSGRFPLRSRETRVPLLALVMTAAGLVALTLSGIWSAKLFVPRRAQDLHLEAGFPIVVGGLGLLLLVVGTVSAAPYAVRQVAALGRLLPLSGRFAFRSAARHRFRTAAAAVTLTVTIAGAIGAAFAVSAAEARARTESSVPTNSLQVELSDSGTPTTSGRARAALATVQHVVGTSAALVSYSVDAPGTALTSLVARTHGSRSFSDVSIVDQGLFRRLVGGADTSALRTFDHGGVVTTSKGIVRAASTRLALLIYGQHVPAGSWQLPALAVPRPTPGSVTARMAIDYKRAWISPRTAARLGLHIQPDKALVTTSRPVTQADLTRLAAYGITAYSGDLADQTQRWVAPAAVAAAGLLTAIIAGMTVALSAAEGRADVATLAAIGAGPRRRRALGAMQGLFIGLVGCLLGTIIAVPASLSFTQINGVAGTSVPWLALASTLVGLPLLAAAAGWLVTPTRLAMVRRSA